MDNLDQRQSTIISPEKKPLPVLKDPKLYLANFFNSKEYRDAIDKFFEGKNPNPQVTEEQKAASFLNYGDIETPLYNFYENNMRIAYDGSFYTPEITRLWSEYTTQIRKLKQNRYDKEEMMAHNDVRSAIHTETANLLVQEEIAPNAKVGKKLLQFMTISAGLEDIGLASLTEAQRRNYQIAGKFNNRVA